VRARQQHTVTMLNDNNTALHYRDGRLFTGTPQLTDKGKPYINRQTKCSRCGGAGGSDKWKHTGWTCFQCGGSRLGPIVADKLYTLEQLAKMNAAADKRSAKKAAAQAAATAAREADRAARRAQFTADNATLFAQAASLNDDFINTMVAQCIDRVSISPAQVELITKKLAENARKQAAQYVGTVGERITVTCTLVTFKAFDSKFGRSYLHVMRDSSGNTFKYMGSTVLGGVNWQRGDYGDPYPVWDKAAQFTFTATVKAHEEYNGDKQTVVARPKEAK
jgi:hypothetical protein